MLLHQGERSAVGKAVGFVPLGFENSPSACLLPHFDPQNPDRGRRFEILAQRDGGLGPAPILQQG